jgi:hypothetical protein
MEVALSSPKPTLKTGESLFALASTPGYIEIRAGTKPPRLRVSKATITAARLSGSRAVYNREGAYMGRRGGKAIEVKHPFSVTRFDGGRVVGTIPRDSFRRLTKVSLESGAIVALHGDALKAVLKKLTGKQVEPLPYFDVVLQNHAQIIFGGRGGLIEQAPLYQIDVPPPVEGVGDAGEERDE